MAKRPPSRLASRKPDADAVALSIEGMAGRAGSDPGPAGSGADASEARGAVPPVANRDELATLLGQLQDQGGISVADEAAILREYDDLLVELRAEKQRLEAEYRERIARDGQDPTDAWLADAAAALGRRQGEQFQQLLKTIPALAPPAQAAG